MKIVKKILLAAAALIVVLLIVALFIKKDYTVEREITINKPKEEVFSYVKYLRNQDHFSKWANMDPNMKKEYRGTDGNVGFVSAWDSDQSDVGKGEQEIKRISNGERIDYEIRFKEPFASIAPAYMITESLNSNQTKVKWGFHGHMNYPLNLMTLFFDMEEMIGNDLNIGLTNLKNTLEKPSPTNQ